VSRNKREKTERRFLQEKFLNAARAKPGPQSYTVVLDHLKPDFNVGKIFRTADAFGAREVCLVGMRYFDPSSSVGSFKHVPARFFDSFKDCYGYLKQQKLAIYRLEPEHGGLLTEAPIEKDCALVLGNEGVGHSFTREDFPDVSSLRIPQWGRAQSLNVSVAAAVAMYELCRRFGGEVPAVEHKPDRLRDKYQN
jgi:tRNA G18 (ribose-2'-O)-methylase SpoU